MGHVGHVGTHQEHVGTRWDTPGARWDTLGHTRSTLGHVRTHQEHVGTRWDTPGARWDTPGARWDTLGHTKNTLAHGDTIGMLGTRLGCGSISGDTGRSGGNSVKTSLRKGCSGTQCKCSAAHLRTPVLVQTDKHSLEPKWFHSCDLASKNLTSVNDKVCGRSTNDISESELFAWKVFLFSGNPMKSTLMK